MSSALDRIYLTALMLLILATPLAIGSAPPRAFAVMEAAIFSLVIVWMLKIVSQRAESRGQKSAIHDQNSEPTSDLRPLTSVTLPLVLLVGLFLFQLLPLPPTVLRLISPSTHEFYSRIFAGWPEQAPYGDLAVSRVRSQGLGVRGEVPEARDQKSEVSNSEKPKPNTQYLAPDTQHLLPATWLPLTVAPYLTKIDLLKLLAYCGLFLLVLGYPYGESWERDTTEKSPLGRRPPDERLLRWLVGAVLASGFAIGFVGFVQRFSWNGKILWFYEPYSTKPAALGAITRASGPFVNPDHFANYLALVMPIALACAIYRTALAGRERQPMLRVCTAAAAFMMFTGILLSLSRGALAAVCMSIAVLILLMPSATTKKRDGKSVLRRGAAMARLSAIVFCALLIVGLYFAGPSGREQVDARLAGGLVDEVSLGGRAQIWRDSPKLIADFPLFGVGLGAWPEVFMRYRSDPWGLNFFREAHNDYIQVISEAGFIGFALVAWFVYSHGRRVLRGLPTVTARYRPVIAGMIAALAGMALHEWFDFNLRIPANAFLFVLLGAVALRAVSSEALKSQKPRGQGREQGAGSGEPELQAPEFVASTPFGLRGTGTARFSLASFWQKLITNTQYLTPARSCSLLLNFAVSASPNSGSVLRAPGSLLKARNSELPAPSSLLHAFSPARLAPYGVIVLSLLLVVQALNQNPIPYPFNLGEAESLAEAKENVLIFPTNALYHDTILNFLGDPPPLAWQLRQLSAALWLEPANPYFRDRYVAALMAAGRPREALREMTQSVRNAPDLTVHPYLQKEALPKLSTAEQGAVEAGLRQAVMQQFPGAVIGLGEFYAGVGRFAEQAGLYERAALAEKDSVKKIDLALRAGAAHAKAQNFAKAERILSDAIVSNRADPRPYQYLIREIYGARKDLLGAKQILNEAVRHSAPALPLQLALAEAAHRADNAEEVASALQAAKATVADAAKDIYPFEMYLQLAEGAGRVGDYDYQLNAMLAAAELQPTDSEVLSRIADIYSARKNYDRAALYLEKLTQIDYNSAAVFYRLARAEEARYRYAAAARAYARALDLDPDNKDYKSVYAAFKQQVAENSAKGKEQSAKRAEAADAAAPAKGKEGSGRGRERQVRR